MDLLAYRNAPLANVYSPEQLLMCRQLRSTVSAHADTLKPSIPDALHLREKESIQRCYQKTTFDTRHRALELPPLETGGACVDQRCEAKQRSHMTSTDTKILRTDGW